MKVLKKGMLILWLTTFSFYHMPTFYPIYDQVTTTKSCKLSSPHLLKKIGRQLQLQAFTSVFGSSSMKAANSLGTTPNLFTLEKTPVLRKETPLDGFLYYYRHIVAQRCVASVRLPHSVSKYPTTRKDRIFP